MAEGHITIDIAVSEVVTLGRWYCVDRHGRAVLCTDAEDARMAAERARQHCPGDGPHRALRLVEATAPLTSVQIERLSRAVHGRPGMQRHYALARAVERAHGIES